MKKLLAILLSISLCCFILVCFSACGNDDSYDDDDEEIDQAENADDEADETETTDDTTSGEDTETEPAVEIASGITDGTDFKDGYALVEHSISQDAKKLSVINTKGEVLFSVEEFPARETRLHAHVIRNFGYGIFVYNEVVYDMTGKVIASPEISGYDRLLSENLAGYVLAMKKEEGFEGDVYSVGVLNNKGEWQQPLSSNNPIVNLYYEDEDLDELESDTLSSSTNYWRGGNWSHGNFDNTPILPIKDVFYNMQTNKTSENFNFYCHEYHVKPSVSGVYKYDLSGNSKLIYETDHVTFLNEAMIVENKSTGRDILVDYSGKVLTDFSEYNSVGFPQDSQIVNGHLLVTVTNKTGGKYLCLMTTSGELAFDPIRMDNISYFTDLSEEGFICEFEDENNRNIHTYHYYDFEGNKTVFDLEHYDNTDLLGDFSNGLVRFKVYGWSNIFYVNTDGKIALD